VGRWGGQRSGGEIAGADTNNQRVRAIGADPAHTVRTLAGNGDPGWRDGPGAQAMFRAPTAVAYGPDGSLYVVDSDNHRIRQIVPGADAQSTAVAARSRAVCFDELQVRQRPGPARARARSNGRSRDAVARPWWDGVT
jgi:hypothetical protein